MAFYGKRIQFNQAATNVTQRKPFIKQVNYLIMAPLSTPNYLIAAEKRNLSMRRGLPQATILRTEAEDRVRRLRGLQNRLRKVGRRRMTPLSLAELQRLLKRIDERRIQLQEFQSRTRDAKLKQKIEEAMLKNMIIERRVLERLPKRREPSLSKKKLSRREQ